LIISFKSETDAHYAYQKVAVVFKMILQVVVRLLQAVAYPDVPEV